MTRPATVHASAVLIGETGVLIRGASGSGKSSLLLALLEDDRFAHLVADDRVELASAGDRLVASAPPPLAGMIEIRGEGIVRLPHISPVIIRMVVDLLPATECPRLPDGKDRIAVLEGIGLPRLILPAGAANGVLRVRRAIRNCATKHLGSLPNPA